MVVVVAWYRVSSSKPQSLSPPPFIWPPRRGTPGLRLVPPLLPSRGAALPSSRRAAATPPLLRTAQPVVWLAATTPPLPRKHPAPPHRMSPPRFLAVMDGSPLACLMWFTGCRGFLVGYRCPPAASRRAWSVGVLVLVLGVGGSSSPPPPPIPFPHPPSPSRPLLLLWFLARRTSFLAITCECA